MVTKIMCKSKNKKKFKSRKKKTMKKKINNRNTKLRSMWGGGGIEELLAEKLARKLAKEAINNPDKAAKRLSKYGVDTSGIDPKLISGAAGAAGATGSSGAAGANPNVAEIIKHFEEQQELKNKQSQGFTSYKPQSPLVNAILRTNTAKGFLAKGLGFASSKAGEDLANKWGIDSKAYKEGLDDAQKNLQPFLKQKLNSSEPSPQSQPKTSWFKKKPKPASASFDPNKATTSFGNASGKISSSPSGNIKASGTANFGGVPASAKVTASPSKAKASGNFGGVPVKGSFGTDAVKIKAPGFNLKFRMPKKIKV